MNESALKISLAISEMQRASLVPLLELSSWLVVIGVFVDGYVVIREYLEGLHAFRRGTISSPSRPSALILALGLLATFLIVGGVAGELFFQSKIGTIETGMRLTSDRLVNLVSAEAGNARLSAQVAANAASVANGSAKQAGGVAAKAYQQAAAFEKDIASTKEQAAKAESDLAEALREAAQARESLKRIETSRHFVNVDAMVNGLSPYHGTEYAFMSCFGDQDSAELLRSIDSILQRAGWKRVAPPLGRSLVLNINLADGTVVSTREGFGDGLVISIEAWTNPSTLNLLPQRYSPSYIGAAKVLTALLQSNLVPPQPGLRQVNTSIGKSEIVDITVGKKM